MCLSIARLELFKNASELLKLTQVVASKVKLFRIRTTSEKAISSLRNGKH